VLSDGAPAGAPFACAAHCHTNQAAALRMLPSGALMIP